MMREAFTYLHPPFQDRVHLGNDSLTFVVCQDYQLNPSHLTLQRHDERRHLNYSSLLTVVSNHQLH
jgi:hypothetical protein